MTTLPTLCIMGKLDWVKQKIRNSKDIHTLKTTWNLFQVDLMSSIGAVPKFNLFCQIGSISLI